MSSIAISNTSKMLRSTLWVGLHDNLPVQSIIENEAAIIFDSPAAILPGESGRLSLWLYAVSMSESFRNLMPPGDNASRSGLAPIQLNLHYLITPYCNTVENDLVLLDGVIEVLHEHPVQEQTSSSQVTSGRADVSIINLSIAELTNLWAALQVSIRPSIACQVRLSPGMRV